MKTVIDVYKGNDKVEKHTVVETIELEDSIVMIRNLPLDELYAMINQHKLHMRFLKENSILSDGKKEGIVEKINHIFKSIEGRSLGKKKGVDDGTSSSSQKVIK